MSSLAENRYGKSCVRLVRVKRHQGWHSLCDWTVEILLRGDFVSCFVEGDNSQILPTDTMKNTVYSLARKSSADCVEEFAKELVTFLMERNPQVSGAQVNIASKHWERIQTTEKVWETAFVQSSRETQTTEVTAERSRGPTIRSGLDHLVILKTAGSEFVGFIKDSLTTLPESTDRLFGTAVRAQWTYKSSAVPFVPLRQTVRTTLLNVFAKYHSKSVQHTLYAIGDAVLAKVPEIEDIELTMPNKHCLLVDLSRFGQDNPNEIFVPIDEPYGYIEARIRR